MGSINPEDQILYLYSEKEWSMSKLGRESDFSYSKVRTMIIESDDVEKRSHQEACNTESFKEKLGEANEGKELSEEHRKNISKGMKNSEKFQEAMKDQSERLRKDISNEKLKNLYFEHDQNAKKVSEFVDLSRRRILGRLKEIGIDTSQDEPWNKGKELSDEHKKKLSEAKKGKSWEEIFGEENAEWRRENIGELISEAKKGHDVSDETRRKLRLRRIEQIENAKEEGGQVHPTYNKNGCEFIEKFGEENGLNFQHAENGGEYFISKLGYWVDGYDQEKNVVIEYDEFRHFKNGNLKEKDRRRMDEIINCLDCAFIRVKAENNQIYLTKNIKQDLLN